MMFDYFFLTVIGQYAGQYPVLGEMYRAESDHSIAESDDVNIMEGGVTILKQTSRKSVRT